MNRDLLQQAFGAMRHDLRKTVLTMLGMAWGIATVVLLLAYGEGWHNNHHARPSLALTRRHWWQLDLVGECIRLLDHVGLVRNVRYLNSSSDAQGERA